MAPSTEVIGSLLFMVLPVAAPAFDEPHTTERSLVRKSRVRRVSDLDDIQERGVLRVITRNNSTAYFIARGRERGFQFELARAFAAELGVRLRMVLPEARGDLIPSLLEGEGDLVAAGMTVSNDRKEKVRFSSPVLTAQRVVATHRRIVKPLEDLAQLPNFEVHLSFDSTTYRDAKRLEAQLGVPLRLSNVPDGVEMEEMMHRLAQGQYEATVVDSNLLDLEKASGLPVEGRIAVSPPQAKAWAFHPSTPKLYARAERFIRKSRTNGLIRILYDRYYRSRSGVARRARKTPFRADASGRISPWDKVFQKEGRQARIDWRLLAAIGYVESRFDANAISPFGAAGVMQVLPRTAKEVRVKGDLSDASVNIRAGTRYFAWLVSYFEKLGVRDDESMLFALAAYNAGLGHVRDARWIARRTDKDPNRWFGEAEDALLLKENPRWHARTRYGYCRSRETVEYVRQVESRFATYARHVPLAKDAGGVAR